MVLFNILGPCISKWKGGVFDILLNCFCMYIVFIKGLKHKVFAKQYSKSRKTVNQQTHLIAVFKKFIENCAAMFYSTKIIRKICISNRYNADIQTELYNKYINRMIEEYGLCLQIYKEDENPDMECTGIQNLDPGAELHALKILKKEIKNFKISYEIEFTGFFYKLFEDEIIEGIVYFQNTKSILIQTPLLKNIICIPEEGMFFIESGFDGDAHLDASTNNDDFLNEDTGIWYWIYDSHKLLIRNQDVVRCRVISMEFKPCRVLVAMNDVGLGPVSWWL